MTQICPRCHQAGISEFAKRWSDRGSPAKCVCCGGLSHVLASTSSGIGVGTLVLFVVLLVWAAGMQSALLAGASVCLTVSFNIWAWRRAELIPIPKENADAASKANWLFASASLLMWLFGG